MGPRRPVAGCPRSSFADHVVKSGKCIYSIVTDFEAVKAIVMQEDELPLANYMAVVLAGGEARRMGRNKLLMEISARPMIRHVVETIRGVAAQVIVVTGHQDDRVREAIERLPVEVVTSDPAAGPAEAINAAFARARGLPGYANCEGILLCVGDQPRLTEREMAGLISAYRETDRCKPLVPVSGERRGFPVVVPPGYDVSAVDLLSPDVVSEHPDKIAVFGTKNPVYGSSVDTPEDYRAFFAI